ncbi:CoA pyrophosphatase [Aliidiomarina quisquiliarum]|uniref:CoA pyrophosphatase n=1 Tax=Aliidiomarina quisquiliarum TaxID=2938947 RepID=UPI00208FE3BA|nr:CoA pyrophosphatase [Aliidiomarina quisquiliarum]
MQCQLNNFLTQFNLHPPEPKAWPELLWQKSAVLIPLRQGRHELEVILTRRTAHLRHHADQICFPGGRMDAADCSLLTTALRETHEELGVHPRHVHILGQLPEQPVLSHFMIQPYVGLIDTKVALIREPNEVAEVLSVPLRLLLDQRNHLQVKRNHPVHPTVHFIPWQGQLIWGATAAIIRGLADQINPAGKLLYKPVF